MEDSARSPSGHQNPRTLESLSRVWCLHRTRTHLTAYCEPSLDTYNTRYDENAKHTVVTLPRLRNNDNKRRLSVEYRCNVFLPNIFDLQKAASVGVGTLGECPRLHVLTPVQRTFLSLGLISTYYLGNPINQYHHKDKAKPHSWGQKRRWATCVQFCTAQAAPRWALCCLLKCRTAAGAAPVPGAPRPGPCGPCCNHSAVRGHCLSTAAATDRVPTVGVAAQQHPATAQRPGLAGKPQLAAVCVVSTGLTQTGCSVSEFL